MSKSNFPRERFSVVANSWLHSRSILLIIYKYEIRYAYSIMYTLHLPLAIANKGHFSPIQKKTISPSSRENVKNLTRTLRIFDRHSSPVCRAGGTSDARPRFENSSFTPRVGRTSGRTVRNCFLDNLVNWLVTQTRHSIISSRLALANRCGACSR